MNVLSCFVLVCYVVQDGNGSIDVQELKSCMLKFGATMTDDEISNVFAVRSLGWEPSPHILSC